MNVPKSQSRGSRNQYVLRWWRSSLVAWYVPDALAEWIRPGVVAAKVHEEKCAYLLNVCHRSRRRTTAVIMYR